MLKTTRSAASTADRNVPGVAAKEKLKAGVRSNGRIGVGDKVEGRFEAGTEWFPATVTKVRRRKGDFSSMTNQACPTEIGHSFTFPF